MIAVHPVQQIDVEREGDEIVITQEDADGTINVIRLRGEHVEWLVDGLRLLAKEMLE